MMAARIVPLALVAAIIACPLLCRNGQCLGCCEEEQVTGSICPAGGTGDGCCPTTSRDGTSGDGEGQRPCDDDSGESGCQGVCGGAVLEKPNRLPEPAEMPFLNDFHASPTPFASPLADRQSHSVESRFDCSMNLGRYIRTLHMSLLL